MRNINTKSSRLTENNHATEPIINPAAAQTPTGSKKNIMNNFKNKANKITLLCVFLLMAFAGKVTAQVVIGSKTSFYGINGSANVDVITKLKNTAYFGPSGTYSPYTITTAALTSPITEASINAAGVKIYWSGYEANTTYTATELTELKNWVDHGGTVIAGCDATNYSAVCNILGLTLSTGNASAGTSTYDPGVASCFPPSGAINNGGGAVTAFTGIPAGLKVITNIATETTASSPSILGKPSSVFGNRIFATSDVNMFTGSGCCTSAGNTITSNNDKFLAGAIANLARLAITNTSCLSTSQLTKSVSPGSIASGGTATYTFTINNSLPGNTSQTGIAFTDTLPSGLKIAASPTVVVSANLTAGSTTATAGGNSISASGYNLAPGAIGTITVNVTNVAGQSNASCGANPSAFTNNSSNITSLTGNLTNNVGNVCLVVTSPSASDLQVTKTVDKPNAAVGDNVAFTIVATNNGLGDNTGVSVSDLLPTGFQYDSSVAPAGTTYNSVSGAWTIGALTNGQSRTLQIYAKVKATGNYTNTAVISTTSGISDGNAANNTASATVSIVCFQQVDGETFSAANGVAKTFTQPATNNGFVFDIFTLDNSFNMTINGASLTTQEIQFQSGTTTGINVRFVDGTAYTVGTPQIYSMAGTAATPLLRIVISSTGSVTFFGSKVSNGPLFPLQLFNGNAFNPVTWNANAPNTIVINQEVDGVTTITGRGYGQNIVPCPCYKPGIIDAGNTYPTLHGITALSRAGANNGNWPMVRQSAWTALEAKTKGFVPNRILTTALVEAIANPVKGMMVFDIQADCLKINTTGTAAGWKCFNTQTCPQ